VSPKTKPRSKVSKDKTIDELFELYKKTHSSETNPVRLMLVKAELALRYKGKDKSEARAKVRGENRGPDLSDTSNFNTDPQAVQRALAESWELLDEEAEHAAEARTTAKEYLKAAEAYQLALRPLKSAFEGVSEFGIPDVDKSARKIVEMLGEADRMVPGYKLALARVIQDADELDLTLTALRENDWIQTVEEAKGIPTLADEQLKAVRNAQLALATNVQEIDAYAQSKAGELENLVLTITARIISWRQSKKVIKNLDRAETLLNGGLSAANTVNGEPMSHAAVQGLHMLIHAAIDATKLIYVEVQTQSMARKKDLDQLDKLQADDYIQWKLDMIKMGLRWVTEPLGFIPNVGALIRKACDYAVDSVITVIQDAAKEQAQAFESKVPQVQQTMLDRVGERLQQGFKEMGKEGLKLAAESAAELIKDGDIADPGEAILKLVFEVIGAPIRKLLVEVVPSMKMLDKEKIKADLADARATAEDMASRAGAIGEIEAGFTFDEAEAKKATIEAVIALDEGDTANFLMAISPELKASGGVALLVGDSHNDVNTKFVNNLVRAGHGWVGSIVAGAKGTFGQTMHMGLEDGQAQKLVEEYWKEAAIKKKLSFSPRK
jgi:hypothetical protein